MATSGRGTGILGYNVQTAVDAEHHLIVASPRSVRIACAAAGRAGPCAVRSAAGRRSARPAPPPVPPPVRPAGRAARRSLERGRQHPASLYQRPLSGIDSCAAVRTTDPSFACCHKNRPRSSRLANRHKPCPSRHRTLSRSPRRPRNTKQRAAMRVETQGGLYPRRQPVKAFPHVGHAARQIDADVARNADHDSADKTRRNPTSSIAPVRRSSTPEGSSTSIVPSARRSGSGGVGIGSTGTASSGSSSTGGANLTGANPVSSPVRNLPAPGVKLAAADPVQSANQRGRGSWRHALRQYPKLLFEAPASPALRTSENLAANLASPRMSTPEGLIIDQPPRHPLHRRRKGRQASNSPRQAQDDLQLTLTRKTNLSVKLHALHPPAPAARRQRPSAAGFLLRRHRSIRPLQ